VKRSGLARFVDVSDRLPLAGVTSSHARCLVPLILLILAGAMALPAPVDADAPRVTAWASVLPASGGWIEIVALVENGAVRWRGALAVVGEAARVDLTLALPAHGRRTVTLPFWIRPGEGVPWVGVSGMSRGAMTTSSALRAPGILAAWEPRAGISPRVLVAEERRDGDGEKSPGTAAASALPVTRRALDALDLVILPSGWDHRLRPEQQGALEQWVKWGGAVGVVDRSRPPTTRALGTGLTIVGGTSSDVQAAYVRWAETSASLHGVRRALLDSWERTRAPASSSTERPGARLRVALAGYVGVLGLAALVLGGVRSLRTLGVSIVVVLIAAGTVATWALARGGDALDVRATTVLVARPDGGPADVSARVDLRAGRSDTWRLVPEVEDPLVVEMGTRTAAKALTWDVDARVWERALAMGETADVRVAGLAADVGVRVRERADGAWDLDNGGAHTLRDVLVLSGGRQAQALDDLSPGARTTVTPAPRKSSGERDVPGLAFWRPLLEAAEGATSRSILLLATLDPPLRPLRVRGDARLAAETRLVIALPHDRRAP
jgi:hypothetical protein